MNVSYLRNIYIFNCLFQFFTSQGTDTVEVYKKIMIVSLAYVTTELVWFHMPHENYNSSVDILELTKACMNVTDRSKIF